MPPLPGGDVRVFDDPPAVAQAAAAWLTETLCASEQARLALCLSGGSTPRALFATLAGAPYREAMPWARIEWFWADERFVPPDDTRSNFGMARALLLDHAPVAAEAIHPVPTVGVTPGAAAGEYEQVLQRYYGATELAANRPLFSVALLGVGEDGHIASLFPDSPALDERHRWVSAVTEGRPEARITLTYPALESTRDVAFLVTGAAKRQILAAIANGAPELPVSRLRPQGRTHWFLDRAAAPASFS